MAQDFLQEIVDNRQLLDRTFRLMADHEVEHILHIGGGRLTLRQALLKQTEGFGFVGNVLGIYQKMNAENIQAGTRYPFLMSRTVTGMASSSRRGASRENRRAKASTTERKVPWPSQLERSSADMPSTWTGRAKPRW